MKVLQLHFATLDAVGGTEMVIRQLDRGLAAQGIEMALAEMVGVGGKRVEADGRLIRQVACSAMPSWRRPRSIASLLRSAWQLNRVLAAERADILHLHLPVSQTLPVSVLLALPHHWALVISMHGPEIALTPGIDARLVPWLGRVLNRADGVIVPTSALADAAHAVVPGVHFDYAVIPQGLDPVWFEPVAPVTKDPGREILFVGRLSPEKGLPILLDAFATVAPRYSDVRLALVGEGAQRAALESQVQRLGLGDRVRLEGQVARSKLAARYSRADLFVLPSLTEALPLSLMEAAACGVPAIATKVGGCAEIVVEAQTGWIIPPGDASALAAALDHALGLPTGGLQAMADQAQHHARTNFIQARMFERTLDLYQAALARHRGAS